MYVATSTAPTNSGSLYLEELLSHWRDEYTIEQPDGESAVVGFGYGTALLKVTSDQIVCSISATDMESFDKSKEELASHIEWLGREESLHLEWEPARREA